jgi:hypothetical protein
MPPAGAPPPSHDGLNAVYFEHAGVARNNISLVTVMNAALNVA